MDRRDFIKNTSLAVAVATGGAASARAETVGDSALAVPAIQTGPRKLQMVMPWAQTGRGFDDSARRLARWLETATDGRYAISIQDRPMGLSEFVDGSGDLYHGSGQEFVALDRSFSHFAGLPGKDGLRPTYLNAWLMAGGGQPLWDELAAAHGVKPLFAGHSGARSKLWTREPIRELADVKGLRIAAMGFVADIAEHLGAVAVSVAPDRLASAFADGHIDAVEWGGTISAYGSRLTQSARHCLRPGLSRNGSTTVLSVRRDVWETMTIADRAIFEAGAAHELNTVVAESFSVSLGLRQALSAQRGIAFDVLPQDVVDASTEAAARIVAMLANHSDAAARIHASYTAFRSGLPKKRAPSLVARNLSGNIATS